jgi:hypothetical protein
VTPTTHDVAKVLHSWKSFTANKINKLLGRTGMFWQDEYYDHLVRNGDELLGYEQYISANPRVAGLPEGVYRLGCGDDS